MVCLILLAPLLLVDVPPLLDYPNHLARAVVLAFGASDPVLSQIYTARWAIIPNLGTDLVLPPLMHILPVHVAGRIVTGIVVLLPVIGTLAYSRALFRGSAAWPLGAALLAYNATLILGFLNFVAAVGLALLLAAAWLHWRDRYPLRCVALATIGAIALFFCHLMGLLFFFLLIAGHEVEQLWLRGCWPTRAAALLPVVAAPLGLYLLSPLAPLADRTEISSLSDKARQLILPFSNYILSLDIATAVAVAGFLLACAVTRRCRTTFAGGSALVLTALLFLAAPWSFKGTYFLDTRFVIMLGFLLFAALIPTRLPRSAAAVAAAVFISLFVIRMGVLDYAWFQYRQDLADFRRVIDRVPAGTRVLLVGVSPEDAPLYWRKVPFSRRLSFGLHLNDHLPALLLIERHAYWPFLFDNPSQQPVATLPPFDILARHADEITDYRELRIPGRVDLCGYDDLLLLNAGGQRDLQSLAADRLQLAAKADVAALFHIRPGACAY